MRRDRSSAELPQQPRRPRGSRANRSASCLPDPYEGLDAIARENAEIAATALDATTVWTLDRRGRGEIRPRPSRDVSATSPPAVRMRSSPARGGWRAGPSRGSWIWARRRGTSSSTAARCAPNVTAEGHWPSPGRHRAAMRARATATAGHRAARALPRATFLDALSFHRYYT